MAQIKKKKCFSALPVNLQEFDQALHVRMCTGNTVHHLRKDVFVAPQHSTHFRKRALITNVLPVVVMTTYPCAEIGWMSVMAASKG